MKRFLKNGPPSIMLGALAAVAALLLLAVGIHAQQNLVTMFGCTSITNCIQANNIPILVDSAGRPQVKVTGAIGPLTIPVTINGSALGTTSTDGVILQNTTAATSGSTVQISPRMKWCGSAWNSVGLASETDCWAAEVLPATQAGTTTSEVDFLASLAGGAFTNRFKVVSNGAFTLGPFSSDSAGGITNAGGGAFFFSGRAGFSSTANGLFKITSNNGSFGAEINGGTAAPTVTTCGTGAVTSHSSNMGGEVTSTGATTCTVTFGSPNFTNQPFCTVTDETTAAALRISAISVSSFTVTNLTAGDKFMFHCIGGI